MTKHRLQSEHIDAAPDRLLCVRVAQLVRVKVHAGLLAPAAHLVGNGLPRQVAVSMRRGNNQASAALQPRVSSSVNVSAEILTVRAFDHLPSKCTWPPPSMASTYCQRNLASSDTRQPIK